MAVPRPRPATRVASVTRNGVMRSTTMQNALTAPKIAPAQRPTTIAASGPETVLHGRDLQEVAGGHCREIHVRPDREVDACREQDEDHADGDHAGERRLLDDVADTLGAEEIGALKTEEDEDDDEDDRRRVAQQEIGEPRGEDPGHDATSCSRNAERRIRSLSNASRANSPTISPRLITRMRSHMASSSSISEEMKSTAPPSPARRSMIE